MATVYVPGVAQAVIHGSFSGTPTANVLHYQFFPLIADWTGSQAQSLADTLATKFKARFQTLMSTLWSFQKVEVTDLSSSIPAVGTSTLATWVGTITGNPMTNEVCAVTSFNIPSRYKGGHPRAYLSAGSGNFLNTSATWNTTFTNNMNAAWVGLNGDINANVPPSGTTECTQVAVRYLYTYTDDPTRHKYHKERTGLEGAFEVLSWVTQSKIGTQRRRLGA